MKRIVVKVVTIAALLGSMAAVNWSSVRIEQVPPTHIAANWNSPPPPQSANVNWSS